MADLPEQIDRARAALGSSPAYRRRGVARVQAPRGDIEVDIDMENVEAGVYLWGALVTDRSGRGEVPVGYRPFCTWEPMTSQVEAEVFAEFWAWLSDLRRGAAAAGLAFRAYCYNSAAETTQMRRIAAVTGLEDAVAAFTASQEWVDRPGSRAWPRWPASHGTSRTLAVVNRWSVTTRRSMRAIPSQRVPLATGCWPTTATMLRRHSPCGNGSS